jgi:hypothetical protein
VIGDYGNEHSLNIIRIQKYYEGIGGNSKTSPLDSTYITYDGKYMTTFQASNHATHLPFAGLPSDNEVAINTLAVSNPSRPSIDVPLFLYELREIPDCLKYLTSYLKRTGQPLPFDVVRDVGGLVLTAEYGVKPLVSDIKKLFDFAQHVKRAEDRIRRLYSPGGIHSKVRMGGKEAVYVSHARSTPVLDSAGGYVMNGVVDTITTRSIWGTTRWSPDPAKPMPQTDEEMMALVRRVAFGADVSVQTLWNAMPWSWLADWAGNMGSYLGTFRNTVPAVHSKVCVMRHTKTTQSISATSLGPEMTGGKSFTTVREQKQRTVMPFVLPETHLPDVLDARQWSILGSLALQRIPKDTMRFVRSG